MPFIINRLLACYIPWGYTSRAELRYYEDTHLYLGLEEPCPALEFLLTLEEYDERGKFRRYSLQKVYPMEVTED